MVEFAKSSTTVDLVFATQLGPRCLWNIFKNYIWSWKSEAPQLVKKVEIFISVQG